MVNGLKKAEAGIRELRFATPGITVQDGDGVVMTRVIGTSQIDLLDPFLLLDAFESDEPRDYLGGFPDHPHRGFETVTYMLAGKMRHKDSMGNEGVIEPYGAQWMTAGRGVVHSEMPEQTDGLLMGFQLWVNLPQKEKMQPPKYQSFDASDIAVEHRQDSSVVRVIAGKTDKGTTGPLTGHTLEPTYMDVTLAEKSVFEQPIDIGDNAFIYVIEGEVLVGQQHKRLAAKHLGVLGGGSTVILSSAEQEVRFLLVAAAPIRESVARGGPFVMNTKEEVLQAFSDFQNNRF